MNNLLGKNLADPLKDSVWHCRNYPNPLGISLIYLIETPIWKHLRDSLYGLFKDNFDNIKSELSFISKRER